MHDHGILKHGILKHGILTYGIKNMAFLLKLALTNLSYQDETWAKFSTLDVDVRCAFLCHAIILMAHL
jgi:hypothetical protein